MKTYYKLTDEDGYTRRKESNETLWGENVRHDATGKGYELCSDGLIHMYESPEMAVFMIPIQGNYDNGTMLLWECQAHGRVYRDGQLKCGAKGCTTLRQINKPKITTKQRVEIAIRCALEVYKEPNFVKWANNWFDGSDRKSAAVFAARAAEWAARGAAARAAVFAAEAARSAAKSAELAAWSKYMDITKIIHEVLNAQI